MGMGHIPIEAIDYRKLLLKWAQAELLKEKVKAKLDKKYGKQLDEIAGTLVEVMVEEKQGIQQLAEKKEDVCSKLQLFFDNLEVV